MTLNYATKDVTPGVSVCSGSCLEAWPPLLVGKDGLTTYYFAADSTPGASVREGECLVTWPPVTVPPGNTVAAGEGVVGVVGLITATDGSTQVTHDGRPLHYWQGDTEAGQSTGHGVNDFW